VKGKEGGLGMENSGKKVVNMGKREGGPSLRAAGATAGAMCEKPRTPALSVVLRATRSRVDAAPAQPWKAWCGAGSNSTRVMQVMRHAARVRSRAPRGRFLPSVHRQPALARPADRNG